MSRPAAQKTGPLFWSGRVLTWEDLRPFLGELQELTVATRTIVSPLVLDELKDRKIALRRGDERASTPGGEAAKKKGLGIAW
jgi:hypothetical protein